MNITFAELGNQRVIYITTQTITFCKAGSYDI